MVSPLLGALLLLSTVASRPASAACAPSPELRDPDAQLTVLVQNLKFIITGRHRTERARLLSDWLDGEGKNVDLLLLSEARITSALEDWGDAWCFYTQRGDGLTGYRWAPIAEGRPPGGLAIGVRQWSIGVQRHISGAAGRRYRARPVTMAEGFLGRIAGYRKGWAGLVVDGTEVVWSHTQASYRRRPARGAGRGYTRSEAGEVRANGHGRTGQFEDLASDLGFPTRATLLTGDLNLLAGFVPADPADEARVRAARDIDDHTVSWFKRVTGLDLDWMKGGAGTFAGSVYADAAPPWDAGAAYDRVGVNEAFLLRHAATRVSSVAIADAHFRVSDHLGLRIEIPFPVSMP